MQTIRRQEEKKEKRERKKEKKEMKKRKQEERKKGEMEEEAFPPLFSDLGGSRTGPTHFGYFLVWGHGNGIWLSFLCDCLNE